MAPLRGDVLPKGAPVNNQHSPSKSLSKSPLSKSAVLYQRALEVLPGGVSRNTVLREPHPLYADHGTGCRVTDIEGVERIDFANNMASLIHGHAHPAVVAAVTEQLGKGSAFMLATEVEIRYPARDVIRKSLFRPGRVRGMAVRVLVQLQMDFNFVAGR